MARPARSPDDHSSEAQRFVELVRSTVPPLHPAGLPFIAGGLGVAAAGRNRRWLRNTGLGLAGFCALFFRHPPRVPPSRPGAVVAPADGLVTLLDTAVPPAELGLGDTPMARISIFLSIFDAHVQRAPVAGRVMGVVHRPGKFLSADKDEASADNERNSLWIRTPEDVDIVAVQIAGLVARRIVCTARTGDALELGETYGLIRFGSRLDTYFPQGSRILVEAGQRAIGGETILAELP
ncbi:MULTISPECIES: phosphatidylserine decarboxylase [Mycolicibacterium]|uniref:Phosphatidylserine decarboxylase proenzyme n=1 Tax=Mycolicibacterium neoaurum TaxID=1795 RepID=A0AAV2WEJ6_MYCNE|nr:phosphatidylserine decarboxylase [Mycolicibacterium neoaurum]TLH59436.1 phosphatidylserine decarboxylase family protein [Mycolicibacterium neoaurum]CDQ42665.1 phosphatidylserine decarboxylase [Mycolicibacterium neoaurum]